MDIDYGYDYSIEKLGFIDISSLNADTDIYWEYVNEQINTGTDTYFENKENDKLATNTKVENLRIIIPKSICKRKISHPHRLCKCGKIASFGPKETQIRMTCSKCKEKDYINLASSKCKCGKISSFGSKITKKREFCSNCKEPDHINLAIKYCKCGNKAIFGDVVDGIMRTCEKHKLSHYIRLERSKSSNNICREKSCSKYASFGPPGGKPLFCSNHKGFDHINLKVKKCHCGKQATFGLVRSQPLTCSEHKLDGYVSTIHGKKCVCGKTPSCGPPGGVRITCSECKLPGHVNIGKWRIANGYGK